MQGGFFVKNRLLLCLLLCAAMLYYAVPRLNVEATGLEGVFAISWLAFAFIVVAGNLTALLYMPKHKQRAVRKQNHQKVETKRLRGR